jgi:hypothetical protein
MNAGKLKQLLAPIPDEMDVYIAEVETGFKYAPVEEVRQEEINFMEEPGGKVLATEKVVIIDSY